MKKKIIVIACVVLLFAIACIPRLQAKVDFGSSTLECSLVENGTVKNDGDAILTTLSGLKPGPLYNDSIQVKNIGSYSAYVRVSITKSWLETSSGNTVFGLSKSLIKTNNSNSDWILDTSESNSSVSVYYYKYPLTENSLTTNVIDSIQVLDGANAYIEYTTQDANGNKTTTLRRKSDGYTARISIEVDAVQSHNGEEAILGAWGKSVSIDSNGVLSLN